MNKMQWQEALREQPKHTGMLFPVGGLEQQAAYSLQPLDPKSVSHLPAPIALEDGIIEHTAGLYRLLETGSLQPGHKADTPWRIVGERKTVGIEIETWSGLESARSQPAKTQARLDPPTLFLDESLFPPALWKEAFEGDDGTAGAKRKRVAKDSARRKKRLDLDSDSGNEDEEKSRVGSESEADDDFDFEEEEEDHQDYDANYFDNGEGDDDDEGGEEGE